MPVLLGPEVRDVTGGQVGQWHRRFHLCMPSQAKTPVRLGPVLSPIPARREKAAQKIRSQPVLTVAGGALWIDSKIAALRNDSSPWGN
jgi:hypothetical protein